MRGMWVGRVGAYLLLVLTVVAVTQPNLGTSALWDDDEGVNAEAAREMQEAGTWIVPTFNYRLRTAKPVLLYWLQRASYAAFGVSEWAARFPASLLAIGTVLLTYELARRMFGPATGLLAGVVLATTITFCQLSHAATPDAPLIFFTTLALTLYWFAQDRPGRYALVPFGAACGLGVLTKGPVGLALPAAIICAYHVWGRDYRKFWSLRWVASGAAFLFVAAPWYVLVTTETRGEYIRAFFVNENVNRFLSPMEGHRGPVVYYLGAVLVFFTPWSLFLGGSAWYAAAAARRPGGPDEPDRTQAYRFLLSWAAGYLVFFSLAATKLPNYIAPLYPALAVLTASFLVRWQAGDLHPARWFMPLAALCLAGIGILVAVAVAVFGGAISLPGLTVRTLPGLENCAALGLVLLAGAGAMSWQLARRNRTGTLLAFALPTVFFIGLLGAFPAVALDRYHAPRDLVAQSGAADDSRDLRLASLDFTAPSVTFYARREVKRLDSHAAAAEFLALPCPAFLFVPEPIWKDVVPKCTTTYRIAARKYDLTRNCDILVVTNERD